jgi:predicted Zn finger-like uncharacterized protein
MPSRKVACPSCESSLKVPEETAAGKKIRCPTCTTVFPLPPADGQESPARERPRKNVAVDEDLDDEVEESAPKKQRRKGKQAGGRTLLIVGGVLVVVIGVAAALLFVFWPFGKSGPVAAGKGPGMRPFGPGGMRGQVAAADTGDADSESWPPGRKVFEANRCGRCHQLGDSGGGRGKFGRSGPSLAKVGADPTHTVDWLMEHVRNPKSHNPESRMPSFDGKINDDDLRMLAEYLASLK